MGRRSDAERIFEAQKAGVRNRLTGNGMQPATADCWLDAWVLEATGRGLLKDGAYWQAGWDWIAGERGAVDRVGDWAAVTPDRISHGGPSWYRQRSIEGVYQTVCRRR